MGWGSGRGRGSFLQKGPSSPPRFSISLTIHATADSKSAATTRRGAPGTSTIPETGTGYPAFRACSAPFPLNTSSPADSRHWRRTQIVQLVPDHERRFGQKPCRARSSSSMPGRGLAAKARLFRRVRAPDGIRKSYAIRLQKFLKPFLARHDSLFSEIPPAHAGLVGHQERRCPA